MKNVDLILGRIAEQIINPAISLMFAIAVLFFMYGVLEFIAGAGNEEKRTQGKRHMIWGIIGIFIMVSVFGIMRLLCETFYSRGC